MSRTPETAFVLAAGLGTRMRPLTDYLPKPLVPVAGRALIDHVLDRIAEAGVPRAVVNVHYLADQIEAHLVPRCRPVISISDERELLLDTGGGVRKALQQLGARPFLIHNSDSIWIEGATSNLARLFSVFDEARMDALLLLADRETSLGYPGRGDFHIEVDGRLRRRGRDEVASFVFTGVSMASPRLLRQTPLGPFSLNLVWDRALSEGRVHGVVLDGTWMHVGDPTAVTDAERCLANARGG